MMFYHALLLKDVLSQGHSALHPEQFALCNTIASLQHSIIAFHRHVSLHETKTVRIWIPAGKGGSKNRSSKRPVKDRLGPEK